MKQKYDFSGWATKNDLLCSDGRTIRQGAFSGCNGKIVPLVWQHDHKDISNVIGHALLEERPQGMRTYGFLNDTEHGRMAKHLIDHGDVSSLSIYANGLKQRGGDVIHGNIKEVSLVLFGANPGAQIDVKGIEHSEDGEEIVEAIIHNDDDGFDCVLPNEDGSMVDMPGEEATAGDDNLSHEESKSEEAAAEDKTLSHEESKPEETTEGEMEMAEKEKTIQDVLNEMTDEQRAVVDYMVGLALEGKGEEASAEHSEGEEEMNYNAFEGTQKDDATLAHAEQLQTIIADAKRYGSLKESFLEHAAEYGIDNIDYLFPDAKSLNNPPEFIKRETGWVSNFMSKTHHTPFSRIKSMFADITEDEARAKGYIKGKYKKEEVFGLLKRTTTPTTVYKKQKLDRDDIIDITDFDVVAWLKTEMRWMLDEEIARAALLGDGRPASSDDKINEQNIRPIYTDEDLFSVKVPVTVANNATDDDKAKAFIKACIKARKNYKGSGNPILYTTEDMVTNMLLLTDEMGRDLYESEAKLATKLRVREIVTVEVMENLSREVSGVTRDLAGIIVNPADYNFGADKGGSVNMFDDFDIDYNQQKYLIETRCSGALVKPYSALVVEFVTQ